jgi:hypothetical protein
MTTIIADENLNSLFIKDLRDHGYNVLSIQEKFSGIIDHEVAGICDRIYFDYGG